MTVQEPTACYDFTGQTIVITGGTGVLGGEIACGLVKLGANVALLGRNMDAGNKVLERMGSRPEQAKLFSCDVLDNEAIRKTSAEIVSSFSKVDALINTAGGNHPKATTNSQQKFFDLPPEALRWVFELNVLGTMLPSQTFGGLMAEQGQGSILNITSMAAVRPLTRVGAYAAAKAAVVRFTAALANPANASLADDSATGTIAP